MRRYIRELRPTSVYDLAAMVALFRPGPMDNIPAYIRRKHGQETVTYLHPLLEPYLEKTYGIFVYQEDIMAAAIALGGFTGPEADTLGYAIRKKKSSVLRAQKEQVRDARPPSAASRRTSSTRSSRPSSRSSATASTRPTPPATASSPTRRRTSRPTTPVEYMTSVLTAFRDNTEQGGRGDRRVPAPGHRGAAARRPALSGLDFTVEGDAIRFGLLAVKNVGEGAIESIIAAREAGGAVPLAGRPLRPGRPAPRQQARAGVAGQGRRARPRWAIPAQLLDGLDDAMAAARPSSATGVTGQASLFDAGRGRRRAWSGRCPVRTEAPSRERLRWEKELLGLYLSDHPLGELAAEIGRYVERLRSADWARSSTSSGSSSAAS